MKERDNKAKLGSVHHYVPQGYLKRFGIEPNNKQVYAYEIDKKPYRANVRNVAGQRDFYTFTNKDTGTRDSLLEDALAEVDDAGVKVLKKLDGMNVGFIELGVEDRGNLLSYIAFQHTRNLQERKNHADAYSQMSSKLMETMALDKNGWHETAKGNDDLAYDYSQVEKARKAAIDGKVSVEFESSDQYFLGTSLNMSKILYEILFTQKKLIMVEVKSGEGHFISSDNPVTHYLLEEQKKELTFPFNGLGYLNAVFQFPISPSRCLLLINKDMNLESCDYDQDAVDYINYHTYYYADRWVFSNESSLKTAEEFEQCKSRKSHWKMA